MKDASMKNLLGYGIGQAGDSIPYCMFYTFFIYFLTDNVGLSPMLAGAISLVAVCWDGITDPIVGYLSDRTKNPKGRRRPWMIKSCIPLGIVVFLLFAPWNFSSTAISAAYYFVVAAAFWTLYTTYVIPYMSLGAEITTDYKGRNYIRMYNMIFGGLFMLLCTSGPTVVQAWGVEHGMSDRGAWGVSGIIFGAMATLFAIICCAATKGTERPTDEVPEEVQHESLIQVLKETWSIRPYRQLCIATVFYFIGTIACSSAQAYLIIYNCNMTYGQQAWFWIVYAIAYTVMVPVGSAFANLMSKKASFMIGQAVMVVIGIIFFITGINSFIVSCVYISIFQFGNVVYWTNYIAFAYDCAEIDEYKTGKRREGSLCAIVSFAQKFGSAIGTYSIGLMLTLVGYDAMAEVQTEGALTGILGLCTLLPAASALIAMIILSKYPVGPKEYDMIVQANEDKKAGKPVDETPFKHCL
ncbi:MAG: glycoside-pentoside-hexuronide (GPH):cation symporter [Bacillota bacterium]|nr:glycoside-pentoside-hexuronide (GPH):cation symporter [Bacillota bacterium]